MKNGRFFALNLKLFFPEVKVFARNLPLHYQLAIIILLFLAFSSFGFFVPSGGLLGFDWNHFFGVGNIPIFYPPWTKWVVALLSWPTLIGLTLAAIGFASYQRSRHTLSLICVFFSLPVIWTLFLGQIDGLVLFGLVGLPWLAPLALLKPQISVFGFLARPSYLIGLTLTMCVSFTVWGFWPGQLFSVWTVHYDGRFPNDIALGLIGLPVALVLMWYSRGDIDMLMLAGTFTTPYFLPYGLIVVAPAIARLRPKLAIIACVLSWAPLTANWVGKSGWFLGWLFIAWLWISLALLRYPDSVFGQWGKKKGLTAGKE